MLNHDFISPILNRRISRIAFIILILFFTISAITAIFSLFNLYWPYNPNQTNLSQMLFHPCWKHVCGTDQLGRDLLSRLMQGSWISLMVGFISITISLIIGLLVGSISGYFGGKIDSICMRFVDALFCFPSFFLILTATALLGPNLMNIIFIIGLFSWIGLARLVRGEFLTLKESEYVSSARILGQKTVKIIINHILPNALAPIFVTTILSVPEAILTESGLSFLGFGVQPPQATWGNIIADGKIYLLDAWWLIFFPGAAIFFVSFSLYVVGDTLRVVTMKNKN